MTGGRAEDLRTALEHAFAAARWQVRDLTDDEYLWEPAEVCWSVWRRDPGVAGEGAGDRVSEWRLVDAGRPVPVTTIAWRLVHLAGWTDVYRDWTFGEAMLSWDAIVVPGDVASAVA